MFAKIFSQFVVLYLLNESVRAQTQLWYHSMDTGNGWYGQGTGTGPWNCISSGCVYIVNSNHIENDKMNTTNYTDIVLQYSIRVSDYEANDYCAAYWSPDLSNWYEIGRYSTNSNSAFITESIPLGPDASDRNVLSIVFQSYSTSTNGKCYIDEIYLFGQLITTVPTPAPTYSMCAI